MTPNPIYSMIGQDVITSTKMKHITSGTNYETLNRYCTTEFQMAVLSEQQWR